MAVRKKRGRTHGVVMGRVGEASFLLRDSRHALLARLGTSIEGGAQ